jgi:hypothetical protein
VLTGTPLDLTPFAAVFQAIGIGALILALVSLYLAIKLPNTTAGKVICTSLVLVLFGYFPAMSAWNGYQQQQRLDEAHAHFQNRCKGAGEKIKRVVDDVDGVVWLKWRTEFNQKDQYQLNDPYGQECIGEECIQKLLRATEGLENDPAQKQPHYRGYKFVETVDPRDGHTYQYTLALPPQDSRLSSLPRPQLRRLRIERATAIYGVAWDDISTRDDRDRWIAGSSLKVIDLKSNEVIAERIGYMFDRGLGGGSGGRQPWTFAVQDACPEFSKYPNEGTRGRTLNESRDFIAKTLVPSKGN